MDQVQGLTGRVIGRVRSNLSGGSSTDVGSGLELGFRIGFTLIDQG